MNVIETTVLGGKLLLAQPEKGYRIGMDGALLAAACASVPAQSGLELGCGVGGALVSLGHRCPQLSLTGIEREADYAAIARANVTTNLMTHRIIDGDIGLGFKAHALNRFDLVFSNPPFFDDPNLLRAPHETKRPAWIADDGLSAWLDFAMAAVKDGGHIIFIHRADRLADLLGGLGSRCGSFQIRPIQPFAESPAKRVLVLAKRLGKAPLKLLPALILHDRGERKHTPEVEDILRGESDLKWD